MFNKQGTKWLTHSRRYQRYPSMLRLERFFGHRMPIGTPGGEMSVVYFLHTKRCALNGDRWLSLVMKLPHHASAPVGNICNIRGDFVTNGYRGACVCHLDRSSMCVMFAGC
eukprot:sb/3477163/